MGPQEGFWDWWEALEQGTLRSPSSTSGLNPRTGVGGRRREKEKNGEKILLHFSSKGKHKAPKTEWPLLQKVLDASSDTSTHVSLLLKIFISGYAVYTEICF